jgi:uncharacterized protein (TIGR00251 family)
MAADKSPVPLTQSGTGVSFAVRVIPRAARDAVAGVRDGALLVRLSAPPVEGAANEALVALLAQQFGVPRRDVAIVSGHASRDKRVALAGVSAADAAARLFAILAGL